MDFYRCEISYRGRKPHGIFRWAHKIFDQMSYLENFYYNEFEKSNDECYLKLSEECSQASDCFYDIMNDLEKCLEVPPVVICMEGKCAYTEEGYKRSAESLKDYKYLAEKYGYNVKIRKVQPKNIVYQDEMQIVFQ